MHQGFLVFSPSGASAWCQSRSLKFGLVEVLVSRRTARSSPYFGGPRFCFVCGGLANFWRPYFGETAARHTGQEFVEFLTEVVERAPAREVHIILDNLSAHKSQVVRDFLATHPNVHFHFTPTYSSWLNQVEIWFSKVERDVIARGIFTSVKDLARKLRRYINAYSANAKPIQWKYSDPTRRIRSNAVSATCY